MAPWIFANAIRNGNEFEVANKGNVFRDFTYIDDVINAILTLLFKERDRLFAVYDIGSSSPHSLKELINNIETSYNCKTTYTNRSLSEEEANYTIANMKPFEKDYGNIDFTPFSVGVNEFCNWFMKYSRYNII